MKKKYLFINLFLMFAVLFAVSYQSVHAFSHHHDSDFKNPETEKSFTSNTKTVTEKDDCPICDFKFTSFLKTDIFSFKLYTFFKESPYSFTVKVATSFFCGSLFSHRGPPAQV